MHSFSTRLKQIRQKNKLSQEELANKLGYSRTTIANYEQGVRLPSADVLNNIADFFEVSIDFLLGRTDTHLTLRNYLFKTNSSVLLFIDSITGNLIDCNKSALSFYGYSKSELLNKSIYELCSTLSKSELKNLLDKARNKKQEVFHLKHILPDGRKIDIRITTNNLIVNNKKAIGALVQDITHLTEECDDLLNSLIKTLSLANIYNTPYKKYHALNVSTLAFEIAKHLYLPIESLKAIKIAGLLHDIGELNISNDILNKPDKLSKNEYNIVKEHPEFSYDKIKSIPFKEKIADIILQHHERIDGSGYPYGLSQNKILLEAKILAVSDVIEAMTSIRPYRNPLDIDEALAEIEKYRGIKYDKEVVDICIRLFRKDNFNFGKKYECYS